ncbi:MAG: hypothetical protein H7256_11535, partial [Bdellovibrio sp.]|nr:hypothetical protein [Bdellovibrio sp.]
MNNNLMAAILLILSLNAWSQEPPAAAPAEGKPDLVRMDKNKKIQLNFSDELITGAAANTDVMFMDNRKGANMKKLIRIRENFNSNM